MAALLVEGGRVVDCFETLINAGMPVPVEVESLTGISTAMLRGAPRPRDAFGELRQFIADRTVVAHNASFDYNVYSAELQRAGFRAEPAPFLCTVRLARRAIPGLRTYSLGPLASELRIPFDGAAHRAMPDTKVCADVLLHVCKGIGEHGLSHLDVALLRRFMRFTPEIRA